MEYNSILVNKIQQQFTQEFPRFYCRNLAQRLEAKERLGLDFLPKCRNPRCSADCDSNCGQKESACVARNLADLPDTFKTFRGCLKLPKDSTPADHRRIKKAFGQSLNRWKKKHGYEVAFRAVLHPTNRTNAHYDFVAFTDGPTTPFMNAWKELWRHHAGVPSAPIVPLKPEEITAVSEYQSKVSVQYTKTNIDSISDEKPTSKEPHFLLNSRKDLGLERVWTRGDFWRGGSLKETWGVLISEWFPDHDIDSPQPSISIKGRVATPAELKAILRADKIIYIPGNDANKDINMIARKLPLNPEEAVNIWTLTEQWGLDSRPASLSDAVLFSEAYFDELPKWGEGYMRSLLDAIPHAVEDKGKWYKHISVH